MAPDYDVAVLGAGAAGLMAAARAAECGARVILLEKNRRAGVKILISGGTRCNITNARGLRRLDAVTGPIDPAFDLGLCRGVRAIQQAFGANGAFLGPSLRRLDVDATDPALRAGRGRDQDRGQRQGLPGLGPRGRRARCAAAAAGAFRRVAPLPEPGDGRSSRSRAGPADPPGFAVRLPDSTITARRVIVTVGGRSYPGCGTTGDGYEIARRLGHAIVEPRPALVPMRVDADWVADLRGVTLPDVVGLDPRRGRRRPCKTGARRSSSPTSA